MRITSAVCLAIGSLLFLEVAAAGDSVTWMLDETIRRADGELFWTSPTAIDAGFDRYDYNYEITGVSATVLGQVVDVTNDLGGSFDLTGSGTAGVLPVVLIDDALDNASTGTSADVLIGVDAGGLGQAAFTNVVLGTAPLGPLRFNIDSIRVEATIFLTGIDFEPGDYNRDGAVNVADYDLWAADYGSQDRLAADGNEDGTVNAADYTVWRDNVLPASAAVPEPAAILLAGVCLAAAVRRRV